jgi:hypothetical protein
MIWNSLCFYNSNYIPFLESCIPLPPKGMRKEKTKKMVWTQLWMYEERRGKNK